MRIIQVNVTQNIYLYGNCTSKWIIEPSKFKLFSSLYDPGDIAPIILNYYRNLTTIKFIKSYKVQEFVESQNHQPPEGTQHIDQPRQVYPIRNHLSVRIFQHKYM